MSITRAKDFGFVTARVRALKSFLLTPQDLDGLLQARDETEALQRLASMSRYAENLPSVAAKPSLQRVEEALATSQVELFSRVTGWARGRASQLLEFANRRFGYENLKLVLTSLFAQIDPKEASAFLLPSTFLHHEECLTLMQRRSLEEILPSVEEDLRDTLTEAQASARTLGTVLPLEHAVDNFYFSRLWAITQSLQSWDKLYASSLIGQEIDIINMLTVLRAKSLRITGERLKELLIRVRFKLKGELDSAVEAMGLQEATAALASGKYGEALKVSSREPEVFQVETGLKRYLARENLKVFASFPLHVGLALAYLNLKLYEISDVRSIIIGKTLGRSSELIRDSLITYDLTL